MFVSPLVDRYNQLKASADWHGRRRAFEHLLIDVFREAHFRVEHNPGAAKPRQTDLFATYGSDRFLIEAKWRQQPVDVSHVADVRDRLGRIEGTPTSHETWSGRCAGMSPPIGVSRDDACGRLRSTIKCCWSSMAIYRTRSLGERLLWHIGQ